MAEEKQEIIKKAIDSGVTPFAVTTFRNREKVFGIKKAAVYILLVMVLGTFVGWFFGNYIF